MTAGSSDLGTSASGLGGQAPWRITATGHHSSRRAPHSPSQWFASLRSSGAPKGPVTSSFPVVARPARTPQCHGRPASGPGARSERLDPGEAGLHLPRGPVVVPVRLVPVLAAKFHRAAWRAALPTNPDAGLSRGEPPPCRLARTSPTEYLGPGLGCPGPRHWGETRHYPRQPAQDRSLTASLPAGRRLFPGLSARHWPQWLPRCPGVFTIGQHGGPSWAQPGAAPGLQGRAPMRGRHAGPANNASL
jgi:hypothetical protein